MKIRLIYLFLGASTLLLLTNCVNDPDPNRKTSGTGSEDYFDFKIDQRVSLSIDYCFPNKDYVILFEVYTQNPLTANEAGETVKRDIEPVYRAATDGAGKFSADIQLLSSLSKVWLYSEYPGTFSPVELEIKNNKITFNQNAYIQQLRSASPKQVKQSDTRAVTGNNYTYPDGWLTLGDWDEHGTPDYLDPERTMPSASTLYMINKIFVKHPGGGKPTAMKERYPEFFDAGMTSNLQITKPTKIYLVFINSTAVWRSTVGYYTYPTGLEPRTVSEVQRTLVFPDVSPFVKSAGGIIGRGALAGGDRVQLKYWDGERFQDEFPAGVSIGWWLEGMGFTANNGNIAIRNNGQFSRFSSDHLNKDGERRTVALLDSENKKIVAIGFEDNMDMRYNDATFYLEVEQDNAIEGNLPTIPDDEDAPSDTQNYVKTEGFLMFEDLWPYAGDYDMNDVMIKYSSKVYKHILNNSVYKIETEYTPCHKGGELKSGFGIQFSGLSPETVHKMTIEGATPSRYMEGQMLEPGQRHPTILLFDDITSVLNTKIVVTAELNDIPESSVMSPYNPFIFVESTKMRGKEVHLVKQSPTDKADPAFFGIGNDGSKPAEGLYYVLAKYDKQYPFALNMSFMEDIPIPQEGVKIDESYPGFRNWVESNGTKNKDWYLHPVE